MANKNKVDLSKIPGFSMSGPMSTENTVIRAPVAGETNLFNKVIDSLPKNFAAGVFGEKDLSGRRTGGVAGFFMLDSFRNAFGKERIYENRRNSLLEEGYTTEQASDFAYRIITGQSLNGLDEETQKKLRWDSRIDKGMVALDTPITPFTKGAGIVAGLASRAGTKTIIKSALDSSAGAIVRRFFGTGAKVANKADEVADVVKKTDAPKYPVKLENPKGQRAIDEVNRMFDEKPSTSNVVKEKTSNFYNKLRTEWTDRFTPIKNLTDKVEDITGTKFNFEVDPYVAARLYQGVNGKIQNTLDELGTFIKKAGEFNTIGQRNLALYLTQARMAERAARGIKNPANITFEEASAAMKSLETPEIKEAADGIKTITDRLLQQSKDAGIISDEAFNAIKKNNQNYVPFDVLEKLDKEIDNVNAASGGFSVAEQNVIKTMQGTDKDIANPLESLVRKIISSTKLVERNEVAKKVARLSELEGVEDIKKFDKSTPLEEGNDVFHVFENGQRVSYQAPKDVIEAMKGMNREEVDMVTSLFGAINKVFRQSVTTLYIGFSIPNVFRDVQDAQLIAKHRFGVIDWAKGLSDTIGKGDVYKQWRQDGGAFSTYVSQATSARMNLKEISENTAKKRIKSVMNPLRLFETIGAYSEEATRLAVYRAALKAGEARSFAALESRQATVDFARSGSRMRVANQWVPFLNARLQGSLNLARVGKERPGRLALRSSFLVGGPTIATYLYNRQYAEYFDIPQWEKDSNFIIMTGTYEDENGESKPEYVKIPKGHIGRIISNPLENFLVFQDSGDPEPWDELALKLASGFSPVGFERDGSPSITAALAGVLPPPVKVPIEVHFANKDFFTERDIVPKSKEDASSENQYGTRTSEFAKDVGSTELFKAMGLSPAGIDQYIQGFLGPLGKDAVKAFDTIRGKGSLYDSDASGMDKLKQIPVMNRFVGNYGGGNEAKDFEVLDSLKTQAADRRIAEDESARQIMETLRVASPEAIPELLKDYEQEGMLTDGVRNKIRTILKDRARKIDGFDRQLKALPTHERANYIWSTIQETEGADVPALLKEYESKGILTDATKEDLRNIIRNQQ